MGIIVDGVGIRVCNGVNCDNTNMEYVYTDGVLVYDSNCDITDCIIFDVPGTYSWTVPYGVTSIELCLVAGGGSGAGMGYWGQPSSVGGGFAGSEYYNANVAVTPETSYTIVVGAGGPPILYDYDEAQEGLPGEASSFDAITTTGGQGGTWWIDSGPHIEPEPNLLVAEYTGNGDPGPDGCGGGGYRDGYAVEGGPISAGGGQASSYGNGGGDGGPVDGGVGAGGASLFTYSPISDTYTGAGGRGEVRLGSGCGTKQIRISEITEMKMTKLGIKRILNV